MSGQGQCQPRVSVIIPAYNSEQFISRAVDSVLCQTYTDYEVIVVDDGSCDATKEILQRYEGAVKYVRQENRGAASARNHGIRLANGEYVAFLDADDVWMPKKLEKQVKFLDDNSRFMMVYCDMSHYEHDVKVHESYLQERKYKWVSSGKIFTNLLHECFIFTPTVMVRKACLDAVGLFNVSFLTCEDVELWMRIASYGDVGFINEPLVSRFDHESNTTKNTYNYLSYPIVMFSDIYRYHDDADVKVVVKERLGQMYFNLGYYQFQTCQMAACRSTLFHCFRFPSRLSAALKYIVLSFVPRPILDAARRIKAGLYGRSS